MATQNPSVIITATAALLIACAAPAVSAGDTPARNGSDAASTPSPYSFKLAQSNPDDADDVPRQERDPLNRVESFEDFTLTGAEAAFDWPPGILEASLRQAGLGPAFDDLGLSVFGYVQVGFTGVLTGPGGSKAGLPLRIYDGNKPDNVKLNQLKMTLERAVDTSKDFDIGGRVDMIYGADSVINITPGLFDSQSGTTQFDMTQFYVQLWWGTGPDGQGFDLKLGKWYTTVGAELIDAPDNYLYSRTMLFGFGGPFTHLGGILRYNFNEEDSIYVAVANGWDLFNDNNNAVSFLTGFVLTGDERMNDGPRSTVAWNASIGPEQDRNSSNYRLLTEAIWTYLWTERLTGVMHGLYAWENNVPGAIGDDGYVTTRDSDWWGAAYTLNYKINKYLDVNGRVEYFRDHHGTRTGFRGDFISLTAGTRIFPMPDHAWFKNLMIRPELRADFSSNQEPFDEEAQFTAAIDFVYTF